MTKQYVIHGKVIPYVRMTRYGKFVNERAQQYMASQQAIALQIKNAMQPQGKMFPDQTPLSVQVVFEMPERIHTSDLDNQAKAVIDAAQGILYKNDSWIDEMFLKRTKGDCYKCYLRVEVI